jgi:hypothetical protein
VTRRDRLAARLRAERTDDGRLFPDYGGYCTAGVPWTALAHLGVDPPDDRGLPADATPALDADHVVLAVLDGFGWDEWRRAEPRHDLLSRLATAGRVTPLTSVYPSETAAALTTLHTGLQPVEHALLGWFQHLPDRGETVTTLPFETLAGDPLDADPSLLLADDHPTAYERASAAGVDAGVVAPAAVAGSTSGDRLSRGATTTAYDGLDALGARLAARVAGARAPSYTLAYVPEVDAAGHRAGSASAAHREAVDAAVGALEDFLARLDPGRAERTALLVVADHGQVDTVPARNPPLDADAPVAGGPRNVQVHADDPAAVALPDAADALTLAGEDVPALFGDRAPSARFERRAPGLVAVPRRLSLWPAGGPLDGGHRDEVGMHGGLAAGEQLVPLAAARASDLR